MQDERQVIEELIRKIDAVVDEDPVARGIYRETESSTQRFMKKYGHI